MAAFLIADLEVIDNEKFERYRQMVVPTIEAYEGRYMVRGGKVETLEGAWSPKRLVIIEFPSADRAKAWLHSPEYAEARRLRHECARSRIISVEGV